MRRLIRRLVPASLRRRFGWRWFRGDYRTWEEARGASGGYDQTTILSRVLEATREVHVGRALWERDGTTFLKPGFNEALLKALLVACAPDRRLDVVDFGGALGSLWWQHRAAWGGLKVRWQVVEQPHYVAAGREFANEQLGFHESIEAALAGGAPAVILFSSVLSYVEDPAGWLARAARLGFRHVIIDRTPFIARGRHRLAVQHNPPGLGGGSYPCWLFDRAGLLAPLAADYELVAEWPALDDLAPDVAHRGFHFRRRA